MSVAGVLLAGGLATRMGGGDKSLLLLAGRPILDYAVERLRPQVTSLALNANGDAARFAQWSLPVLADTLPGNPGPMAGILAGMRWAAAQGFSDIVTVPADTPFIPDDLVTRLDAARREVGAEIGVAMSAGRRHPAVALWPVALADSVEEAVVGRDVRAVIRFQQERKTEGAEFAPRPHDPFFNINAPEQLAEAERLLR